MGVFFLFHGVLRDTPKKSRDKNLIVVPLKALLPTKFFI